MSKIICVLMLTVWMVSCSKSPPKENLVSSEEIRWVNPDGTDFVERTQSLDDESGFEVISSFGPQEKKIQVDRNLFGRAKIPVWTQLSQKEEELWTLLFTKKDYSPKEYLLLALVASGEVHSLQEATPYVKRIEKFVTKISPEVRASFGVKENSKEKSKDKMKFIVSETQKEFYSTLFEKDQHYVAAQSSLKILLDKGHYNCVSSALIVSIILRYFDFDPQGAKIPSHIFVEVPLKEGSVKIETTNPFGFDQQHTKEYYNQGHEWFEVRGLIPSSYQDFINREILDLKAMIGENMINQHTSADKMSLLNRMKLYELRALLLPRSHKVLHNYVSFLNWEHNILKEEVLTAKNKDIKIRNENLMRFYGVMDEVLPTLTHGDLEPNIRDILLSFDVGRIFVLTDLKKPQEALSSLKAAAQKAKTKLYQNSDSKKNLLPAFANLTNLYVELELFTDLEKWYEDYKYLISTNPKYQKRLGRFYLQWAHRLYEKKQLQEANLVYQKAKKMGYYQNFKNEWNQFERVILQNEVHKFVQDKDFQKASEVLRNCRIEQESCAKNFAFVYGNWVYELSQAQNYSKVISLYPEIIQYVPNRKENESLYRNIGVAYLNEVGRFLNKSQKPKAKSLLKECVSKIPEMEKCATELKKLR